MKKILIFSLAYYPSHVSGAEIAIKEITDRIDPGSFNFHLITLRFDRTAPRTEQIGHVWVHRVGWGGGYLSKLLFVPLAALTARTLHRRESFDAIWTMMTYMLLPTILAKGLGVRVPHILTLQDGDPYERVFERLLVRPVLPLIDRGFRSAAVIQAISRYLATWPSRRGVTVSPVIIPNGYSLESTQTFPPEELRVLAAEVGKTEGVTLLLTSSRLAYQKGIDTVIRALALLPPTVHLLVVGDGPEREKLEGLVLNLKLQGRVVFVGHVDRTMTAKYRKVADVFISPSRSEGQGIAFLSSMAAGIPVVATQVGGLADFIFDAQRNPDTPTTAWAVDPDEPAQIARAVSDILANPEKARTVAATAQDYVRTHFTWDVIAQEMEAEVFGKATEHLQAK